MPLKILDKLRTTSRNAQKNVTNKPCKHVKKHVPGHYSRLRLSGLKEGTRNSLGYYDLSTFCGFVQTFVISCFSILCSCHAKQHWLISQGLQSQWLQSHQNMSLFYPPSGAQRMLRLQRLSHRPTNIDYTSIVNCLQKSHVYAPSLHGLGHSCWHSCWQRLVGRHGWGQVHVECATSAISRLCTWSIMENSTLSSTESISFQHAVIYTATWWFKWIFFIRVGICAKVTWVPALLIGATERTMTERLAPRLLTAFLFLQNIKLQRLQGLVQHCLTCFANCQHAVGWEMVYRNRHVLELHPEASLVVSEVACPGVSTKLGALRKSL